MANRTNEIVLRPRFQLSVPGNIEDITALFDQSQQEPFVLKRLDEHVYIRFEKKKTTFWTPQLHLELTSFEEGSCTIHGVFGPNPTLWTFFMFLHFGLALLFISLGIFAYSNYSLGHDITFLIVGMFFLVLIWFVLYAFGRMGKSKGKPQMEQLKAYLLEILSPVRAT